MKNNCRCEVEASDKTGVTAVTVALMFVFKMFLFYYSQEL